MSVKIRAGACHSAIFEMHRDVSGEREGLVSRAGETLTHSSTLGASFIPYLAGRSTKTRSDRD